MANKSISSNFRSLFNLELAKRFLSAIIFVPIFIFFFAPRRYFSNFFIHLFFIMILSELVTIFKLSNLKIVVAIYILLVTYSIVLSPFYYFSLDNNFFYIYLFTSFTLDF